MFSYIHGKLAYKLDSSIVVDTGGVGYEIFVADNSNLRLAAEGENVSVYTVLIVKEDDMSLYGFSDRDSVKLFRLLLTVSGIGAKVAMAIFSALSAEEITKAITFGDALMLTRANGVGKKGAERIILELSDKIGGLGGIAPAASAKTLGSGVASDIRTEAIDVLLSLGYSRSEAGAAVMGISDETERTEDIVRAALRSMG